MGKVNMRYLDAHESSSHDYSAVTRTDQEDTSQCWCLTDFGSDTFTIQQRVNMKFLDAHEGSNDHSAVMRDDQGNDSQKWIISAEPTATAANGQSWTDSQQVCTNQGKQLCTFDNICPNGEGSTPVDGGSSVGHDWSPMLRADGVTNDWVHISGSGHTNCKPHGKYHGLPDWGTQSSNIYNHRIYCCDQPSTAVSGNFAIGSTVLEQCYPAKPTLQMNDHSNDAWSGSIEYSSDAGTTYSPMSCTNCGAGQSTHNIVFDGNTDGSNQADTQCLNGATCKIVKGGSYTEKYTNQWPHCSNIACPAQGTRESYETQCNQHSNCNGFSFTAHTNVGSGCLKDCSAGESSAGYGQGTHGYWTKVAPTAKPCYTIQQKVNMRYLDAHESSSHDYSAVTRTEQEDTSQC